MGVDEFTRIAELFNRHGVAYALVGGLALGVQGLARATNDIDFFVRPDADNISRVKQALREAFDDPSVDEITVEDLSGDYPVVRYGPPDRDYLIDIIARLGEAFSFEDIDTEMREVNGVPVCVATPAALYRMKHETMRLQDRADAEALRQKFGLEDI